MEKKTFWTGKAWGLTLAATGLGSLALGAGALALRGTEVGTVWAGHPGMREGLEGFGRGAVHGHGGMLGFGLLLVLLVGVLVFSAARRHATMTGEGRPSFPDPLADLAEAYASGQVTREEYRERKAVLEETK